MERGGPTKETPADPRRGDGGSSSIRGGGIYKSNKTVEQQLSGRVRAQAARRRNERETATGRKGERERDKPGGEKRKAAGEERAKQSKRER